MQPAVNTHPRAQGVKILPWLLSFFAVLLLLILMLAMQSVGVMEDKETVTIRSIEVALPPPPEPPPPIQTRESQVESPAPSIDLVGPGTGPTLNYSDNPKLTMVNLEQVKQPEFDTRSLDLKKTLSVDFPILEVKELDKVPRLVSTNKISFPREMRSRGINRIATKVEIIIDQNGQAFVKKIVDPVYPEMIEVIRQAINDSRFTIPTKEGRPVQAVYLYTLVFINKV